MQEQHELLLNKQQKRIHRPSWVTTPALGAAVKDWLHDRPVSGGNYVKRALASRPFLNILRKERVPVSIFLVNGIKLQGQIESFDQFVVLLKNTVSQMVYKHAISTVVPARMLRFLPTEWMKKMARIVTISTIELIPLFAIGRRVEYTRAPLSFNLTVSLPIGLSDWRNP